MNFTHISNLPFNKSYELSKSPTDCNLSWTRLQRNRYLPLALRAVLHVTYTPWFRMAREQVSHINSLPSSKRSTGKRTPTTHIRAQWAKGVNLP